MARLATPARRGVHELTVGDGPLQLLKIKGRYLLRQGDVAIDVTSMVAQENYPMGRVTLTLRRSLDPGVTVAIHEPDTAEVAPSTEPVEAGET